MIGCLILGTFAAMGAARLVRHHRMRWAGCHGGYGGYGHDHARWHGHEHGHGHGFGFGPAPEGELRGDAPYGEGPSGGGWGRGRSRHGHGGSRRRGDFVIGMVLDRLRVTPTQERTIRAAADEFRDEVKRAAGDEGKKTRLDLAAAMRKPTLDEMLLGDLFARQDTALEGARKALIGLMAKIHDALDEEQRGRLAELMEKGPGAWRRGFDW